VSIPCFESNEFVLFAFFYSLQCALTENDRLEPGSERLPSYIYIPLMVRVSIDVTLRFERSDYQLWQ